MGFHVKTSKTSDVAVLKLVKEISSFDNLGEYEKSIRLLSEVWKEKSNLPDIKNLSSSVAAELLLRCGATVGYLGSFKQTNTQELSKNLLSDARNRFKQLFNEEKIAECENHLALAYWRTGEYVESKVWIDEALSHQIEETNEIRLHTHIIKTLIFSAEEKFQDIISYLIPLRKLFESSDFLWKGSFCSNLGIAYKNTGKLNEALRYLMFARFCHRKSKHNIYLATVENNLALLYKLQSDFSNALSCADNAIKLFTKIGDRARIAFTIDTKAQIYIAKKNYRRAIELSDEAIEILRCGESSGLLSEVYLTKANALVLTGKVADAVIAMSESLWLAKNAGENAVRKVAETFEINWYLKFPPTTTKVFVEKSNSQDHLTLDLPPEILPNQKFFGVWIKNTGFENLGLEKGLMALAVKSTVEKGDLVAVCDTTSDTVSIGYFEREFGLICLANFTDDPILMNEDQVEIIGKIVGYCESEPDEFGRYKVNLLKNDSLPLD